MKNFKRADCFIQAILLLIPINLLLNDKGTAWWGKLTSPMVFSFFIDQWPVFAISLWQLVSAIVHTRFTQFNIKKARLAYFILLLIIIAVLFKAVNGIGCTPSDAIAAISRLSVANLLLALCYFILCVVETKAISKTL